MDRNPYSPPQTDVREAVEADLTGPRPKQVTWAVRLFWIELAVSVLDAGLAWYVETGNLERLINVVASLVSFPLEALVIYKIGRRRNWARYVALASVIVSTLLWSGAVRQGVSAEPVTIIMGAIELMLDGVALYLLFANPGKQWFK